MVNFDATRGGFGYESPTEGATNDWWTPPEIVDSLGAFDLDPCAGIGQTPLAKQVFTLPDQDGLTLPWEGRVWCNPPYGPNVGDWVHRMADHKNGIMLIFARVETKAWRSIWNRAEGIFFPFRRITFLRPDGKKARSGTAPSAFIIWGETNMEAIALSGMEGALVNNSESEMFYADNPQKMVIVP